MVKRHQFHPVSLDGQPHWHHWIVTEYPLKGRRGIGSETRVAYELLNAVSEQVPTTPEAWALAQAAAGWVLAPAEITAFRNLNLRNNGEVGAAALEVLT